MRRSLPTAALLAAVACSDPARPPAAAPPDAPLDARTLLARYVALGTSNSMGVRSAGISAAGQRDAWPAQLAARAGVAFTSPLVEDPGCNPPLVAPLAANLALAGGFTALGRGDDLVSAIMTTCAPLRAGITLPTNSVAISGADVHDALHATVESQAARNPRIGTLYSRVLAPGQTQVTAMLAERPTFVSVELAANDVLPASTGRVEAMTPYEAWEADYDSVLAAVRTAGARAVLVGLPDSAAHFPSIRRASELWAERSALALLGIGVAASCATSANAVFVPGYLLSLLAKAPATATCADVPGAVDYVLTPADLRAIDERMARIDAHIRARADERGYAYFALAALYDLPKPTFRIADVLLSATPFGDGMSLDGVHPSARGQSLLADAAARAITARYGATFP